MGIKTNNDIKSNLAISGLYNVIDPEIDLNIIDLGLVYQIDFNEESKTVVVTMTLTTQFCPMGESIIESATQAVQESFPDDEIQVNLTFDPPWDTSMITEEGNTFLRY